VDVKAGFVTVIVLLVLLFQPKHDHNLRDSQSGDTPLMFACLLGRVEVVTFLLQSATYCLNNRNSLIAQ